MAAFLIMSGLLNGVFAALDALLFYVFFEATLIPMFVIIGVWGGAEPGLRGAQVLPLHAARLAADAGRAALPLQQVGRQLRHRSTGASCRCTLHAQSAAVLRPAVRLRGQGADVAGAHLAARRARRGAHRRLGGAGGDHAEARRLRLRALLAADPAGRLARAGLADDRAVADRGGLHRPGGAGADRHEEADRLLVDLAHGLRDAGLLHLQRLRRRRRRWCR